MFEHLQIYNPRERMMVGVADAVLGLVTMPLRLGQGRVSRAAPRRILVLRLERIGDLLMTLAALDTLRMRAPDAHIHLVVGSWNAALTPLLPGIDSWETLDAPWLARGSAGDSMARLGQRAWGWRSRGFDLALNFEPDLRSNLLLALSGAPRRVGFRSAGGGNLLTDRLDYNPRLHAADNLARIVDTALPAGSSEAAEIAVPRLRIPQAARDQAQRLLREAGQHGPMIGLHVSGGRQVKQWRLERFAEVGVRLARRRSAAIVLTGTTDDRPYVEQVAALLPSDIRVIDVAGAMDLAVFGAVLEQLHVLVTGDTGPMHLAAAVGTPIVAIFGPSDPRRYGPLSKRARVITADLWCRPCNRVRIPPARCSAGVPDCLNFIGVDTVVGAANDLLDEPGTTASSPAP